MLDTIKCNYSVCIICSPQVDALYYHEDKCLGWIYTKDIKQKYAIFSPGSTNCSPKWPAVTLHLRKPSADRIPTTHPHWHLNANKAKYITRNYSDQSYNEPTQPDHENVDLTETSARRPARYSSHIKRSSWRCHRLTQFREVHDTVGKPCHLLQDIRSPVNSKGHEIFDSWCIREGHLCYLFRCMNTCYVHVHFSI